MSFFDRFKNALAKTSVSYGSPKANILPSILVLTVLAVAVSTCFPRTPDTASSSSEAAPNVSRASGDKSDTVHLRPQSDTPIVLVYQDATVSVIALDRFLIKDATGMVETSIMYVPTGFVPQWDSVSGYSQDADIAWKRFGSYVESYCLPQRPMVSFPPAASNGPQGYQMRDASPTIHALYDYLCDPAFNRYTPVPDAVRHSVPLEFQELAPDA